MQRRPELSTTKHVVTVDFFGGNCQSHFTQEMVDDGIRSEDFRGQERPPAFQQLKGTVDSGRPVFVK